jgi:SpoVK/Ycf46/Vps4 family AAA+-type ATPase
MNDLHDLELMLGAQTPIIIVESLEELRILQFLVRSSSSLPLPMYKWTVTEGISRLDVDYGQQTDTENPQQALKHIKSTSSPGYFTLLDFHPFLDDPVHIRLIKEIALNFDNINKYLVFISYSLEIPRELKHLCAHFSIQLPTRSAIKKLIKEEAVRWKDRQGKSLKVQTNLPILEKLASNLSGVTSTDARRLIRIAIENDGAITASDLPEVMKAKYQLMSTKSIISFEYDTARFSEVAGLDKLKAWLGQRAPGFIHQKTSRDQPKGIMLLGVQGCGKSLAAKAVAGLFDVPLLRLDFSALYNKYHGETERNLREALSTADVMAPCVLWIDEIEKGLSTSNSDDGVSHRVLGSLLTWMAERKSTVFVVATSNDITRLPPELVRKGRLDEIFFVDLPDETARQEIFSIHLASRDEAVENFDLPLLAASSEGFSGAEIEQAVVSSLYTSQSDQGDLSTRHLLDELALTRPLSVVMGEKIAQLRHWAQNRTVPAN